jgi:hypothetical protein
MRRVVQLVPVLMFLALSSAQVVDRMVAVVNKRVLLESELDQAIRVESLLQGKPLAAITAKEKAGILDQLIDRSLLEQQIVHAEMLAPSSDELAAQVKELRSQLPGAATDEGWNKLLKSYGISQEDVEDHIASQSRVLRFVDLRFRGLVRVDKNAIQNYYDQKLAPELRSQGAQVPPVKDVSGQIEKVLQEQGISEMLGHWLETLRSQAHIEKMQTALTASGTTP